MVFSDSIVCLSYKHLWQWKKSEHMRSQTWHKFRSVQVWTFCLWCVYLLDVSLFACRSSVAKSKSKSRVTHSCSIFCVCMCWWRSAKLCHCRSWDALTHSSTHGNLATGAQADRRAVIPDLFLCLFLHLSFRFLFDFVLLCHSPLTSVTLSPSSDTCPFLLSPSLWFNFSSLLLSLSPY